MYFIIFDSYIFYIIYSYIFYNILLHIFDRHIYSNV